MTFALGKLADLLHEGKRFPEIAESKCALDAAGSLAQRPTRSLRLEAQGLSRGSGGTPPRHGVHVLSARLSVMCLAPNLIEATAGELSAIVVSVILVSVILAMLLTPSFADMFYGT